MSARAWTCFAAVSVLWGIPYMFIKIAVDDGVPPVFLAWARVVIGAAVLLPIAWKLGLLKGLGDRTKLTWLGIFTILEIVIPWPLISFGETRISSSLTAILIASVPMIVAMLALRFDASERVDGLRLTGLLVGLAGVVLLVGVDVAGNAGEMLGAVCVLIACIGYAAGPMLLRIKLEGPDALGLSAASLGIAAVILAPPALMDPPDAVPSGGSLASIFVLGAFCSALAFVLFFNLIREVGAGRAAVITYIAPTVAVALGVTLLDETLGVGAVAGLLLILAGSWLSTDGRLPPGLTRSLERMTGRTRARTRAAAAEADVSRAAA